MDKDKIIEFLENGDTPPEVLGEIADLVMNADEDKIKALRAALED